MGSGQEGCPAFPARCTDQSFAVSQTTVCRRRKAMAGGKSELRRAVRRVTPGQGDLKDSGTENIPP